MTTSPVTSITDELLAELEQLAGKATPGPWEVAETDSDGSYGAGPDTSTGFIAYGVCAGATCLLDTLNSDAASISEELDGEGRYAWDETGKANAHYIARANPATILALLQDVRELKRDAERYRWLIENSDMMHWENMLHFADLYDDKSVGHFIDTARSATNEDK